MLVFSRHALCEEFRAWLSAVTQIELEPTIDISCAKYEYTGQSTSDPFPKASAGVEETRERLTPYPTTAPF